MKIEHTLNNNLLEVDIKKGLLFLSLPLILGGLLESLYNLFDMLWLSGLGEQAVSAAGLGGMFIWLAQGVMLLFKVGSQVLVSQNVGAKKLTDINEIIQNSLKITFIVGIVFATTLFVFADPLVSLFRVTGTLKEDTIMYTRIMAIGLPSYFMLSTYTGIYNGLGKTKVPFIAASIGIMTNIILDPIFIYNFNLGVAGAALASIIAFNVDILFFIIYRKLKFQEFPKVNWFKPIKMHVSLNVIRIGFPMAIQSIFFTLIAMSVTSLTTQYGPQVIGAQRIGVSIESLCFLVARALQTAQATFVGQNFGAKAYSRINKSYRITVTYAFYYGLIMNIILYVFARQLFSVFTNDEAFLYYGMLYLRIIAFSQIATMIEGVLAGYFSGYGYTKIPSMVGIVGNFTRLPLAIILSKDFGIQGIWFAVSISGVLKGLVMFIFAQYYRKNDKIMKLKKDVILN